MAVVSMPSKVPLNEAYSNTMASKGTFPVLSPTPNNVQLTDDAPYNHAVAAFDTAL